MSLYRTYRPKEFTDVSGQEHVVTTLKQAIASDKLAHAYLFAGSRGTGKTSVARILAKTVMTQGIEDEVIKKQVTKGVEDGSIVDLLEIDAASNRGIDDVRDLIEKIQFSPVVASAKVYIIDEVHMLTKEAFNALLKTLEEPPEYAYFILATTELNKIPVTIQSRCQCFPFRHIKETDIIKRLEYIASEENIEVEPEALQAIAHHSDGGLRDAISLLDQLRSLPSITTKDVHDRIGTTGHEFVESVVAALASGNKAAIVDQVRLVEEAGVPMDVFARHLLAEVRKTLHQQITDKQNVSNTMQLAGGLLQAIKDIRNAPVPGLVLEAALIQLSTPSPENESAPPPPPPAKKPEPVVEAPAPSPEPAPKEEATPATEPTPAPSAPKKEVATGSGEPPAVTVERVRQEWPKVVAETKPASVKMSLKNGHVTDVEGDTIILNFSSGFHRDRVKDTDASRAIETVIEQIFSKQLKLSCRLDGSTPQKEPAEDMVNLAEAAADIF